MVALSGCPATGEAPAFGSWGGRELFARRIKAKKKFFFEKKAAPPCGNQKTFVHGSRSFQQEQSKNQKFFASFFQKRSACLIA
jgi:hypothetical protein